jgi:hypothetical protein
MSELKVDKVTPRSGNLCFFKYSVGMKNIVHQW